MTVPAGTGSSVSHTGVEAVSKPGLPFRRLALLFAALLASSGLTHLGHLLPWTSWALPWAAAIAVVTALVAAALWPRIWKVLETRSAQRGSEQVQLALAVEATQLGIWEYDVATGQVQCSDSLLRILGHTPGTVLTRASFAEQVHPDDRAGRDQALALAVRQGEGAEYRMDFRVTRPDGALRWVESRGRVCTTLRDGISAPRLTGALLDITERREILEDLQRSSHRLEQRVAERTAEVGATNARLLESEQRFRSAFDSAAIGMALVGLEGQWLQVNRALCRIVGYPSDVLFTKTFQEITHPEDIAADLDLVSQLLSGAIPSYDLEKRYIRSDGSATWVLLTASLIRDAGGEPRYFISQIQDIDARKRAEGERDRGFLKLEEAKDAAEAANRAKSEFLARMSHELRTPLNSIIGFSDLLLEGGAGSVNEGKRDCLEPVVRNGLHLLGLIDDILDLSKIEAGRSDIEMGPVDVCRIIDQLALDFEPQLQGRQVRLETELPAWGRPAPAWADAVRLRQVVLNLVSNAVKFTREGRVTVRLAADETTRRVRWVEVEDTGIGIPADQLDLIFDAFEQVQSANSRQYGGTGLGLTISRRICEQMGCALEVTSQLGVGSVFRITFPAASAQVET